MDRSLTMCGGGSVHDARRDRLEVLMAGLARGDLQAIFAFHAEFGSTLAGVLRRELARLGRHEVPPEDLDGLVLDACLELAGIAGAWQPQRGAAPWTWAAARMTRLASDYVGIHAEPLERGAVLTAEPPVAGSDDPPLRVVLEHMAERHAGCRLLLDALDQVSTPRNGDILLEVRLQASLGDPAPAVTVGQCFGLRPAAVRQVVKRTRDALGRLAADDPRYAPLAVLSR